MIDPQAGMRIAHLLGRRKAAATSKPLASPSPPTKASAPTAATPARSVPTTKPQPKAEHRVYVRSGPPREEHPQLTGPELRADLQAAVARDKALYGEPTFAERAEFVAAQIEGRKPRANLVSGPSQARRHVTAAEILDAGRGAVI